MIYLLDTNTCIRFINGRVPPLRVKLLSVDQDEIIVCSVIKAEMNSGAKKSQTPLVSLQKQQQFFSAFRSLLFDDAAADYYSTIRADLEQKGTPISHHDIQIATNGLLHNLIVVTHNTREFSRISGLKLDDWEI